MKIAEKVSKLEERISRKEIILAEKRQASLKLKNEIKAIEKSIEVAKAEIEHFRFLEISELMHSKSITAEALKQAIMSGGITSNMPEKTESNSYITKEDIV